MNTVKQILCSSIFWIVVAVLGAAWIIKSWFFSSPPIPLNVDYDPSNLNQADSFYRSIADSLEVTMATPSGFGTDEEMIFSLTESLNKDEVKKVYSVFGQRKYAGDSFFSSRPKLDLVDWLKSELSGEYLDRAMVVFSSVWH